MKSLPLLRSTGIYTITSLINSAIPFFLLPVLTRYMSPHEYGIVAMFSVLVGFASPLVGLNLQGVVSMKFFHADKDHLSLFIGNCLQMLMITMPAVLVAVLFFKGPISAFSAFPADLLWMVVVVSAGQTVVAVVMTVWQLRNNAFIYGLYQILQTAALFVLALILVVGYSRAWKGMIETYLATALVFGMIGYLSLRRAGHVRFGMNGKDIAYIIRHGLSLIPHALGGVLISQTDKLFITNMIGVAETGIFTVAFQVSSIIELLATSFHRAYYPWLCEKLRLADAAMKMKIVRFTYGYFVLLAATAAAAAMALPFGLKYFLGRDFVGVERYLVWLCSGFAFNGMYYMVTSYIFYAQKTHILSWITVSTGSVNILLNYILIGRYGAVGAAQATAISYCVSFLLTWMLSAKVYKMPWNLMRKQRHAA